MINTILGLR